MKKWILKQSKAKSAGRVGVIKITNNNLSGDFMKLDKLGDYEYRYYPNSVGIYRIINNASSAEKAMKGCILVYKYDGEGSLRYLSVEDEDVRQISDEHLQDADYINQLGTATHNLRYGRNPGS